MIQRSCGVLLIAYSDFFFFMAYSEASRNISSGLMLTMSWELTDETSGSEVVKNTGYSSRGQVFNAQHPHGHSQLSMISDTRNKHTHR